MPNSTCASGSSEHFPWQGGKGQWGWCAAGPAHQGCIKHTRLMMCLTPVLTLSTERALPDSVTLGRSTRQFWATQNLSFSQWGSGTRGIHITWQPVSHAHSWASARLMNQKLWVWNSAVWVTTSPQMVGTWVSVWEPLPYAINAQEKILIGNRTWLFSALSKWLVYSIWLQKKKKKF